MPESPETAESVVPRGPDPDPAEPETSDTWTPETHWKYGDSDPVHPGSLVVPSVAPGELDPDPPTMAEPRASERNGYVGDGWPYPPTDFWQAHGHDLFEYRAQYEWNPGTVEEWAAGSAAVVLGRVVSVEDYTDTMGPTSTLMTIAPEGVAPAAHERDEYKLVFHRRGSWPFEEVAALDHSSLYVFFLSDMSHYPDIEFLLAPDRYMCTHFEDCVVGGPGRPVHVQRPREGMSSTSAYASAEELFEAIAPIAGTAEVVVAYSAE